MITDEQMKEAEKGAKTLFEATVKTTKWGDLSPQAKQEWMRKFHAMQRDEQPDEGKIVKIQ